MKPLLTALLLLAGCPWVGDAHHAARFNRPDADGDGYPDASVAGDSERADCDDADPTIHPDAEEICGDRIDSDCDGSWLACELGPSDADLTLLPEQEPGRMGVAVALEPWLIREGITQRETWVAFSGAPEAEGIAPDGQPAEAGGALYLVYGFTLLEEYAESTVDFSGGSGPIPLEIGAKMSWFFNNFRLGESFTVTRDADGDGCSEVATGAPSALNDHGVVLLLDPCGPEDGLSLAATFRGDTDEPTGFGASLDNVHGFFTALDTEEADAEAEADTLLIGAPDLDGRGAVLGFSSAAELDYGEEVGIEHRKALLVGETGSGARAGETILGGPDLQGDGREDVIVADPGYDGERGRVYLLPGGALISGTSTLAGFVHFTGTEEGSHFGAYLASGDLDGDGLDDLVVGAPGVGEGRVAIFLGAADLTGGSLDEAEALLVGEESGDGFAVVAVADMDEDGVDDLWVGAPGHAEAAGAAYLIPGSSDLSGTLDLATASTRALFRVVGEAPGDELGASLAAGGDVLAPPGSEGPGTVMIGAPGVHDDAGATWLFSGRDL